MHGIAHDTIDFVKKIITTEMNSATDNPIVIPERGEVNESTRRYFYQVKNNLFIRLYRLETSTESTLPKRSTIWPLVNKVEFHCRVLFKRFDSRTGVHELAAMSERRTERLVNPALSELPAFLVREGGLNSGFMIAHCTAAALVSENKCLCHPSSVDSLSTSAGTEDHVSMGGYSARKALQVVANVERVIAIELLAACQAIEFLRPLKTTVPLEEVYRVVRSVVGPWDRDRFMAPDIDAVTQLLQEGKIWDCVKGIYKNRPCRSPAGVISRRVFTLGVD